MSSVGTSNCSVWVLLFSASARAQARLFEFLQLRKENLLVFAGWNGCHPIRAIVNFNALTRVLRTPGREELYESLDTSKPLAAHRFALWEPWTREILARCCGDWGRQKRAKINILGRVCFARTSVNTLFLDVGGATLRTRVRGARISDRCQWRIKKGPADGGPSAGP